MAENNTPQGAPAEAGTGAPSAGQSAETPAPEVPTTTASPKASTGAPPREPATATPSDEAPKDNSAAELEELRAKLAKLEGKLGDTESQAAQHAAKLEAAAKAMRAEVLDRLGVAAKFRDFAPEVDAYTDAGRQALEKWAADNPELLTRRPSPTQDMGVEVGDLLKDKRGAWLVDVDYYRKKLRGA